jgi:hypothetical protein
MSEKTLCHLCNTRPPRRACPALERDICAQCCGTEREQTIACPLDCGYLRDARLHEKMPAYDSRQLPSPEVDVNDRFMSDNEQLAKVLGGLLFIAAMDRQGTVDSDVRDALDSLITTFKSAGSGLIYDARPENAVAADVVDRVKGELAKFREGLLQRDPNAVIRDGDILKVFVYWQRFAFRIDSGRRKSRAFIEILYSLMPPPKAKEETEGGIITAG